MPTLAQLKGEKRPLSVEINGTPLSLHYYASAATPELEELILELQRDEAGREQRLQTLPLKRIVCELVADWELYASAEDEKKKKNALPVSLEILHVVPISAQWSILLAIFQDLQPDPPSAANS